VSGSGITSALCKSAPWPRHITMPASHHSVFYRPDALPATQPTASKHWRQDRKQYVAYWIAPFPMTLSDFQGHSSVAIFSSAISYTAVPTGSPLSQMSRSEWCDNYLTKSVMSWSFSDAAQLPFWFWWTIHNYFLKALVFHHPPVTCTCVLVSYDTQTKTMSLVVSTSLGNGIMECWSTESRGRIVSGSVSYFHTWDQDCIFIWHRVEIESRLRLTKQSIFVRALSGS